MSTMAMRVTSSPPPAPATARTTFSLLNSSISCNFLPSLSRSSPPSLSYAFNPLRSFIDHEGIRSFAKSKTGSRSAGFRVLCYSPAPLTPPNLQWISTFFFIPLRADEVLILARGTAVPKSYIVPLFALQAPAGVISWIKGRYGVWTAFLALLIRLFFYIPGELELPFLALLLVMVAPYEAMKLRDTKEGAMVSLLIAVYLAFQHFSRTSLQQSFDQVKHT
ncbi:Cold-regulated 413 inner membrane protein 2, chloroplastic [Mucuna pruriens]|uniref:Cold-regulated 413 inner membrane protein 2, chloroplastic n=1 Tax=Mucuna pruriens TaxID=157652 RepID=A0A371FB55_MUCPR|nr:Cold-regulated 413 inner membrane protein 2, chloroplastic [Mucuna pruriens]